LNQNSIKNICTILKNHDGCEFDIRLTKDDVLVLWHDAWYQQKRVIDTEFRYLQNILSLEEFVNDPKVIELVNNDPKTLWIEVKEERNINGKSSDLYNEIIVDRIEKLLKVSCLDLNNIYLVSFSTSILKKITEFKKLLIVPYYDCSSYGERSRKRNVSFDKIIVYLKMFLPLKFRIQRAKELGFNGLLFPKQYLRGFISMFQPSIDNILTFAGKDFILGTDADTFEEEQYFKNLVVITNYNGARTKSNYRMQPLVVHNFLKEKAQ
jgi:hypothetical protein